MAIHAQNNLSIGKTTAQLLTQLYNELFIMEELMATGIKGNILKELNIYRNYLISTCRYDIATGDEKEISINYWK